MMTRETRLLLATSALSIVVVLVLSTLRFPGTTPISDAPPAPLERLAASAAYEQLARSVERVSRRVAQDLMVVQIDVSNGREPRTLADLLRDPVTSDVPQYFPALRMDNARAVFAGTVDQPGAQVSDQNGVAVPVIAVDWLRGVTLLDVPRASGAAVAALTLSALQTPTYVVVAEGTAAGITFRPVFVGSADRFSDPRWSRQLLAVSGTPLTSAGALVFSLEGQFVGAAVVQPNGTSAIAGAAELIAVARELSTTGMVEASDFEVGLQPLTPELSRILGTPVGVVVASVGSRGPAATILEAADVIVSIEGTPVSSPDVALVRLAKTAPNATLQLEIVRKGQRMTVPLTLRSETGPETSLAAENVRFERVPESGSLVTTISPQSRFARAGMRAGDLIVRAGDVAAPTPEQLKTALRDAAADGLVLIMRRDDRDRVIAVPPAHSPR